MPDTVTRKLSVKVSESKIFSNNSFFSYQEIHILFNHYHLTSWPDHGVPEYGTPLMILQKQSTKSWSPSKDPILVHCSAGVGRTGTFIAVDIALETG